MKSQNELFAISNAHGLYNSEQFVLRLSPVNHRLMSEIGDRKDLNNITPEQLRAYSTYLHETIHWWQHIGSTVGFMLSCVYPNQTHACLKEVKQWSSLVKPQKSIRTLALSGEQAGYDHTSQTQALGNSIVNTASDLDFYKRWLMEPGREPEIFNAPYFEAQGHSFWMSYANLIGNISPFADPSSSWLEDPDEWGDQFYDLRLKQVPGYYYRSPIWKRDVGVRELFEAQASFSQMQFLAGGHSGRDLNYFRELGLLHGVYEAAFLQFLQKAGLVEPQELFDPVIFLFLLVCDLSINPVDGFPCEISNFERLVFLADPGCRFEYLCNAVRANSKVYLDGLKAPERENYIHVATELMSHAGLEDPQKGWRSIRRWHDESTEIAELMTSKRNLTFGFGNTVHKVLLSYFIQFTLDKAEHPEFFCWPGYWKSCRGGEEWVEEIWLKHLSLFTDKEEDNGIFIRQLPNVSDENLQITLNNFYGNNVFYDLVRQWILQDGPFKLDFNWLSEVHSQEMWDVWANANFSKQFGLNLGDIECL